MTSPMSDERLAEIKARCEAATPGEWHSVNGGEEIHERAMQQDKYGAWIGERPNGVALIYPLNREANAEFIAHAQQDIPDLLAEVVSLQSQLDKTRTLADIHWENMTRKIDSMQYSQQGWINQCDMYAEETARLATERDEWKRRAEALERALYRTSRVCDSCQRTVDDCDFPFGCGSWQFDEAKYATKDGEHGENDG